MQEEIDNMKVNKELLSTLDNNLQVLETKSLIKDIDNLRAYKDQDEASDYINETEENENCKEEDFNISDTIRINSLGFRKNSDYNFKSKNISIRKPSVDNYFSCQKLKRCDSFGPHQTDA